MSRAAYLQRAHLDRPRPGRRWHRLLAALNGSPMTFSNLFRATDPGVHDPRRERRKVKTALRDLAALGLVERVDPWGWVVTAEGAATLAELDRQATEPPACAA